GERVVRMSDQQEIDALGGVPVLPGIAMAEEEPGTDFGPGPVPEKGEPLICIEFLGRQKIATGKQRSLMRRVRQLPHVDHCSGRGRSCHFSTSAQYPRESAPAARRAIAWHWR